MFGPSGATVYHTSRDGSTAAIGHSSIRSFGVAAGIIASPSPGPAGLAPAAGSSFWFVVVGRGGSSTTLGGTLGRIRGQTSPLLVGRTTLPWNGISRAGMALAHHVTDT